MISHRSFWISNISCSKKILTTCLRETQTIETSIISPISTSRALMDNRYIPSRASLTSFRNRYPMPRVSSTRAYSFATWISTTLITINSMEWVFIITDPLEFRRTCLVSRLKHLMSIITINNSSSSSLLLNNYNSSLSITKHWSS